MTSDERDAREVRRSLIELAKEWAANPLDQSEPEKELEVVLRIIRKHLGSDAPVPAKNALAIANFVRLYKEGGFKPPSAALVSSELKKLLYRLVDILRDKIESEKRKLVLAYRWGM